MSETKGTRQAAERMAAKISASSKGQIPYEKAKRIAVDAMVRNEKREPSR